MPPATKSATKSFNMTGKRSTVVISSDEEDELQDDKEEEPEVVEIFAG